MKAITLAVLVVLTFDASAKETKSEVNEICTIMTQGHVSMFDAHRAGVPKLTVLENFRKFPASLQLYFKAQADDIWAGVYKSYPRATYEQTVFNNCKKSFAKK